MAQSGFNLRAGRSTIAATAAPAALHAFVAQANAQRRVEGLPDELNPAMLDADKVAHLAAALAHLPTATRQRLDGHDLYLDDPGLRAHAAFPSHAEGFDHGVTLDIQEIQGDTVMARTDAPIDLALARSRARDGAARFAAAPAGTERPAAERRLALARYWQMNATAWAQAAPGDAEAATAAAAADKAARDSALPPRGGTVP